jgi:hypothetical protein
MQLEAMVMQHFEIQHQHMGHQLTLHFKIQHKGHWGFPLLTIHHITN